MTGSRRKWTENEKNILKKFYPDYFTRDVAILLKRSDKSIYAQANLIGLKKSPEFLKAELERQGNRLRKAGVKSRFKPGHEPANKGKPMPKEVYEKAKHTMFKKGLTPKNTKYDGHERVGTDGYIMVRVKKGKYVEKSRMVWEKYNGKIPRGYNVVFRDGNKLNCSIENLEMITNEELLSRNTIARFPPELISTIKLVNKLKRLTDA